jgi:glycerol-3-phosphate acyltransferase PlsX
MIPIALDAFGSDLAPVPEVRGALQAVAQDPDLCVVLVGNRENLMKMKELEDFPSNRLEIHHAEEKIPMDVKPTEALRKYQNSSLSRGLQLLKEGKVRGFVSAGNTGAIMAFSLFILGRIPGIKRPAIAAMIPSTKGAVLLIDAGANSSAKPLNLLQFSIMATHYIRLKTRNENPRVGLLSLGKEETKGDKIIEKAFSLMRGSKEINFVGLVEGNDFFTGVADIIVTDGFTGNVILKFGEGIVEMLYRSLKGMGDEASPLSGLEEIKRRMDYQEYGGAPLLGVAGTVIISHGRSTPRAIEMALLNAKEMAEKDIIETLKSSISAVGG